MVEVDTRYCPQTSGLGYVKALPLQGYYQKDGYSCGYVSALMVLRHYLGRVDDADLYKRLGTNSKGTRQRPIVKALRRAGLKAEVRYDFNFTSLCHSIDEGKLVIGYRDEADHWVVFYGYGTEPQRVLIADPSPLQYSIYSWEKINSDLKNFGIICSKKA